MSAGPSAPSAIVGVSGVVDRGGSVAPSVSSLLSSMKQQQTYDYLRAGANQDLRRYLDSCSKKDAISSLAAPSVEVIQFADSVVKINRKQKRQERVLVITDKAIYNFVDTSSFKAAKRRILIRDVRGLILSRSSDELVFQVEDSYDYRYEVRRRSEVLEMLSKAYERVICESNAPQVDPVLMVTFSEEKLLRDMVITKDVLRTHQQVAAVNAMSVAGVQKIHVNGREPVSLDIPDHHDDGAPSAQPKSPTSAAHASTSSSASGSTAGGDPNQATSPSHHATSSPETPKTNLLSPASAQRYKNVRQSLITHGATLLTAQQLTQHLHSSAGRPSWGNDPSTGALQTPTHQKMRSGGYPSPAMDRSMSPQPHPHAKHGSVMIATSNGPMLLATTSTNAQQQAAAASAAAATAGSASSSTAGDPSSRSASRTVSNTPSAASSAANGGSAAAGVSGAATHPHSESDDSHHGQHAFRDPNSRLEGWLTKQKGSSKRWDRKYFILTHRSLQYYAPRIKGNVKIKQTVVVNRYNSDISLATSKKATASSGAADGAASAGAPLIMLRIESSTHLKGKDALVLAFATEEDAAEWQEGFLNRNEARPEKEYDTYLHLEGWLMRKEKDKWARRYVVLTQDRCWFFEMVLKGSVEFTKGVSAHAIGTIEPTEEPQQATNFAGRYALTRFAYRWNVSDSVRIFHLAADSEEDMAMWIGAIDLVNREHGKGGGASGNALAASASAIAGEEEALAGSGGGALKLPSEFIEAVEQPAPEGLVTFVFTDVQNSTNLWEKVPDAMDAALEQHDRILRELLKKFNGYEVKTEGDAFMVTFFSAIDAVLWCLAVQVALLDAEWSDEFCSMSSARKESARDPATHQDAMVFNGIRIRMGIHTGYPNARRNPVTGRMDYFGPVVNRSARVSDTGHGGQVVCTTEVLDAMNTVVDSDARVTPDLRPLVQDMGAHALKGINEPVRIYQLMPTRLRLRTLPPIRTSTNEKLEEERKKALKASSVAAAAASSAAAAAAAAVAAGAPSSPSTASLPAPADSAATTE